VLPAPLPSPDLPALLAPELLQVAVALQSSAESLQAS
jgi:hypothetical protein